MIYTDVKPRGEILHYDAVELHWHGMGPVQVLVVDASRGCFAIMFEGTHTENLGPVSAAAVRYSPLLKLVA